MYEFDDTPFFELKGINGLLRCRLIEKYRDSNASISDVRTTVSFTCHDFSAEARAFNVALYSINGLIKEVTELYQKLEGEISFWNEHENDFNLNMSVIERGHIFVSGSFGRSNACQFEFETEQSYLPGFVASLEQFIEDLKKDN
jgi:hypothetical protein